MNPKKSFSPLAFGLALMLTGLWNLGPVAGKAHAEQQPVTLMGALSTAVTNAYDVILARETVKYKQAQVRIDKGEQDVEVTAEISFENEETELTPYYQSVYQKSAEETQTLTSSLEAEKELESGITLTSGLSLERKDDSLNGYPPDNTSEVYFKVTLPVLKLWKSGLKIGKIKNSQIDLDASRKDLAATVSTSVQSVADAFWEALAQKKMLTNYLALENDARTFLKEMVLLVEKKEYPAANLDTIRADLQSKEVSRITAEQSYYEALQALALEMGMDVDRLAEITAVDGDFPKPVPGDTDPASLIRIARETRPDLMADKIRVDYYRALLTDAREDLLPDLDLSLKGGYQGLEENSRRGSYVSSAVKNVPGPTYSVGVSYTVPLGNNVAEGQFQQARIALAKEQIEYTKLLRTVTSDVLKAHQALKRARTTLKLQQQTAQNYKTALEKETLRFKLQMASLSDQMDARDDYYSSLNTLVTKQQTYAQALARIHQACGTLVTQQGENFRIREASLFSPSLKNLQPKRLGP